ncbi:MAG: YkgJ family cysteine cluster protein [SAR324 cluster bacterium]|nr:YkgJ family cysteine cluster protein [SAR324 cluster bacterium]
MSKSAAKATPANHSELNKENFNLKPIPPEGIFSFACHPGVSCYNRCCHQIDVILTPLDILNIKTKLNLRSDEFLTEYTDLQSLSDSGVPMVKLRMRKNSNGACIFLAGDKGCSIYENRPHVCRSYPLGVAALDPREAGHLTEGQSSEARFMIQEEMCMGHREPKTWTLKEWMKDQGTFGMEQDNKPWLEIVAKLKAMKIAEAQQREVSLFMMVSYDLDTFWKFVFESSFQERFAVDQKVADSMRSDQVELLKFGMEWLQFALFGEGPIQPKQQ